MLQAVLRNKVDIPLLSAFFAHEKIRPFAVCKRADLFSRIIFMFLFY
jgi:hypothetical protein